MKANMSRDQSLVGGLVTLPGSVPERALCVTGRTRRETCGSIRKLYSKAWLQNKQGSFSGKQEQHGQDKEKS